MTETDDQIVDAVARLCDQDQAPLLMFDYDGTLAPFVIDRDRAFPYPETKTLLEQLNRATLARLVVVSGRPADDISRLLGIEPQLETWGCHGWERRTADGKLITGKISEEARVLFAQLQSWLEEMGLSERMELKPASIALHWRGMETDQRHTLEMCTRQKWQELEGEEVLQLHEFDGGLEWRLPNWSKANAVETLLQESPDGIPVAYFGDDLTDEDAFRALPEGGVGILVREQWRDSAAGLWLRPPHELNSFLGMLLDRLRTRHGRMASSGEPR